MKDRPADPIILRIMVPLLLAPLLAFSALPKETRLALWEVREAAEAGRMLEAAGRIEQAAGFFPWRADLWEEAGHQALSGGDPEMAIRLFRLAEGQNKLSPAGLAALGDAFLAIGQESKAAAAWERAAGVFSNPDSLYAKMLGVHRSQKDYPAVVQDLLALTALHPSAADLFYELGLTLAATQPEAARQYLARAVELDASYDSKISPVDRAIRTAGVKSEPAFQLLSSGRALAGIEEWELAAEAFRQAVHARPDYAEAWAFLGEAYQHTGVEADIPLALEALQTALDLDPNSLAANSLMAFFFERRGEPDLALAHLQTAARSDPDNPVWWAEMARIAAASGDSSTALQDYQQAIQRAPGSPVYWELLAEYTLQNQLQVREVGLPAARQAVTLAPQDPRALDVMGQTLLSLGDYGGAERFLQRSLLADPNYADAHLHLGMAYLLQGNLSDAQSHLEYVQALVPASPAASHAERLLQRYFP